MSLPDCECCHDAKATTRVPHIGHVCDGCVSLLDWAHSALSVASLELSGCQPVRRDQQLYDY